MLRKLTRVLTILSLTGLLLLLYLGVQGEANADTHAQAILSDPSGNSTLEGRAVFMETPAGLAIEASSLLQDKYAIANRSVNLHAQRDDFSHLTGNAGARLSCDEIKLD